MDNEEKEEMEEMPQSSSNALGDFYNNNKKLVWIFCGIIIFVLLISVLTKGGKDGGSSDLKYDLSITEPKEQEIMIAKDGSVNIKATVTNDTNPELTWEVEDESVATVDNGNVASVDYGKTKVTVTYSRNGQEDQVLTRDIIVVEGDPNVELTNVSFKNGDLFMPLGGSYNIKLVYTPTDAYVKNKTFMSSDENVVRVDDKGTVTAVGEGGATITFGINDEEFIGELQVYVDSEQKRNEIIVTPTSISFDGELRKIKVGAKEKLSYSILPENADKDKLIWESTDKDVVTVDESGRIKGISKGSATIILKSANGKRDEIDIEVEEDIIEVTDINLSLNDVSLNVGQSVTITPVVIPSNASNKALSFSSTDSGVAYVSGNDAGTQAEITGISGGTAKIVVRSNNGIEKVLNVKVKGSEDTNPGGSSSSSQGFKISSRDANNEGYIYTAYEKTKPMDNGAAGPVTISLSITDSSVDKLIVTVCDYSTSECEDPKAIYQGGGNIVIENVGEYVIKVVEYDSSGNEIKEVDKYIWVKTGKTKSSSKPTIKCLNPDYTGKSVKFATCENGTFSNGSDEVYTAMNFSTTNGMSLTCSNSHGSVTQTCYYKGVSQKASTAIIECLNPTYTGQDVEVAHCTGGTLCDASGSPQTPKAIGDKNNDTQKTVYCKDNKTGVIISKQCTIKKEGEKPTKLLYKIDSNGGYHFFVKTSQNRTVEVDSWSTTANYFVNDNGVGKAKTGQQNRKVKITVNVLGQTADYDLELIPLPYKIDIDKNVKAGDVPFKYASKINWDPSNKSAGNKLSPYIFVNNIKDQLIHQSGYDKTIDVCYTFVDGNTDPSTVSCLDYNHVPVSGKGSLTLDTWNSTYFPVLEQTDTIYTLRLNLLPNGVLSKFYLSFDFVGSKNKYILFEFGNKDSFNTVYKRTFFIENEINHSTTNKVEIESMTIREIGKPDWLY